MRVRDGPAAVRGGASPPARHWPSGWEGGGEGSLESEDLPPVDSNPSRKEDSCSFVQCYSSVVALVAFVPSGLSAERSGPIVHVRVEGKTTTIFGATQPRAQAATALAALDVASGAGEFYYHVQQTAFGPYVDQIGRYSGSGSGGWVFKVNGASPPVGADKVELKAGDVVLWYWATFTDAGGPLTLELRAKAGCYRVFAQDDSGKELPATDAVLRLGKRTFKASFTGTCIGKHHGLVRAIAPGAVRSNALR